MRLSNKIFMLSCVALLPLVPQAAANVTITRDDFGVPTITGGNFAEVSRAIGKVHAEDRLWQIFLLNTVANGRAAQYFGQVKMIFIFNQMFSSGRSTRPIKKLPMNWMNSSQKEQKLHSATYVEGLNDYVAAVNRDPSLLPFELFALGFFPPENPVPKFTLNDILRAVRYFAQSFSPTQIPMFQLNNLVALGTLAAEFGSTAGYAIFEDVDPTTAQVRPLQFDA